MVASFSIIMQSYLDVYNGSRKDPEKKFIRAVNSFLNQKHKDNELIIISDDCDITEKLYLENFKDIKNIVYERVENKERKRMYEESNSLGKFYRGYPRSVGQNLAKKDFIGYMDSDDIILPEHISNVDKYLAKHNNDLFLMINNYEMHPIEYASKGKLFNLLNNNINYNNIIKNLESSKLVVNMKNYFGYDILYAASSSDPCLGAGLDFRIGTGTQRHFHSSTAKTKWADTYGTSEDHVFSMRIQEECSALGRRFSTINSPTYVFCHRHWPSLNVVWDY